MNTIRGVLICQKCGATIATGEENDTEIDLYTDSLHFCPKVKWKYDFESPLTIIEQYTKALNLKAEII